MKLLLIILGIFALIHGLFYVMNPQKKNDKWETYKIEWGKQYKSNSIDQYRRAIFEQNAARIEAHNSTPGITHTEGINQFTDLTEQEFISTYLGLIEGPRTGQVHKNTGEEVTDIDWRDKGAVSGVKDQGQCGSCWAFSAVGGLEGLNFLYGSKKMELFSEQMLVDCSKPQGNHGCGGGLMTYAYNFVKLKGIKLETEYPYVAKDQTCKFQEGQFTIGKYTEIKQGACEDQANALSIEPIAVAVDASRWSSYTGGIFSNCQTRLNHGVTLVAVKQAEGYWVIKNSWGTRWGEKGFMRVKYGNTCGICNMSCYPQEPKWK